MVVPEAEPLVGELRLQHDWSAQHGVPAHITVLFPFAPPDDVDEQALAELFARFRPVVFALDRVERFDDAVTWLHPQPSEPFVDLTAAVAQRFPYYPPYEGAFDEPIPHLTVSDDHIDLSLQLPVSCHAAEVTLIEEGEDGMWTTRARFPLGQRTAI